MSRELRWAVALCTTIMAGAMGITCSATNDSPETSGDSTTAAGTGGASSETSSTGLIDASASGGGGPGGDCDASCQAAGGTCKNGVCVLVENPGGLDPSVQTQLDGGGSADAAFKWLYPYDKTVFPRGLIPPTLQLDGAPPDAVLVHATAPGLDYKGYYGASSPGRVKPADPIWIAITMAVKGGQDLKVDLTKSSGGQISGPVTETWGVAQGSLRGTIYYETYGSTLAGGLGSVGIMKIDPGAAQPVVLKSGCANVCHTASADGSTLVSATGLFTSSISYDLKNNAATIKAQADQSFTYGGLYPDGSFLVSATNYRTWFGGPSRVWDTKTGLQIPTPSWDNAVTNGGTTAFAPDGKMIAFNHEDTGGGHTLATMDYDKATNAFTNLVDIASDPGLILAWPAFTPDTKWVVYHAGTSDLFETDGGAKADLFFTDVATHTSARLDALDGYEGANTYLPASDPNLSFAPTVLPEAVGGYFWVVFTSHRSYGNTLPSLDNGGQNGKLWVAALDLSPTAGKDASHPAFYLDGQEAEADNLRGFWVLDPCKQDGLTCESGDECCGGFCYPAEDGGPSTCSPTSGGCSNEYDKCTTAADCCDPAMQCINGKCAQPPPS